MRTVNHLFARLIDQDHLAAAAQRTTRGKRRRADIAWFLFNRERELAELHRELADGSWQPWRFHILLLRDPKPRVIARASVRDRVVHNAVTLLCEPIFLRSASETDLACRKGAGQHRAVLRLLAAMREYRFALHLDVRSYFASIDTARLYAQIERRIRDRRFLEVVQRILDAGRGIYDDPQARAFARMDADWPPLGRGLPIGAATSQLFAAHVYMAPFDHWVKRDLKVPAYVRYVDDLFLFGNTRADLRRWSTAVKDYLAEELDLRLKHEGAPILSCRGHLDGLGMRVRRDRIEPLPRTWRRLRGCLGSYVRYGMPSLAGLERSLAARAGGMFFG